MQAFIYHYHGLVKTFDALFKGKYLLFFLPGLCITLLYWWFNQSIFGLQNSLTISSDYSWVNWIGNYVNVATEKAFSVFGFILEQLYIFLVITALSPFNTFLAEKFDTHLTGRKHTGSFVRFINDFFRMIYLVFVLILIELSLVAIYWLISWILGLGFADGIVYFCIKAFFFGISFYDFGLERDAESVMNSLRFAFANPLSMLLTGALFLVIYKTPFFGIPISPVITVMVSTVVYLYLKNRLPIENKTIIKENE